MVTTLLQILIPLAYTALGIAAARYVWQGKREVPAVYGELTCTYTYQGHVHSNSCYERISERCGDDTDAGALALLSFFVWPVMALIAIGYFAITWRTPQTTGEKILALRQAEAELQAATERMERARKGT
jgi:hypothetical protein